MSVFEAFPKLARLSRDVIVTEKIDGTNAQVIIDPVHHQGEYEESNGIPLLYTVIKSEATQTMTLAAVWAGSRTRIIRPGKDTDNFGFAAWVFQNGCELAEGLGFGRHFGEWYGSGIQRGYGLDHKRFALFNTERWADKRPACCDVVPVLYCGPFDTEWVDISMRNLVRDGSYLVRGFMNPEGIVVYHTAARTAFKKTFENDEKGKDRAA